MMAWGLLISFFVYAKEDGQIRLKVNGVRSQKGHVLISVFSSARGWPKRPSQAARVASLPANTKELIKNFSGLEVGRYAVAMIHDENDNHTLDVDENGKPTEGIGFSNNPTLNKGPASFMQSSFELKSPATELRVNFSYP